MTFWRSRLAGGIAIIAASGIGNALLSMVEVSRQTRLSETDHQDM